MPYTPVLATLGYVLHPDEDRVLMVHRNARGHDLHLGKYNGLGGKLEPGENIVSGMCRELLEEAGITVTDLQLRGTISWPGFGKNGEDWFGFIFVIHAFSGSVPERNSEGDLRWVPRHEILDLPLWPGDRYFLPLVFDADPRPFHGVMPYADGQPLDWQVHRLPLQL
jgi:8-oxo-dGTP diphosphatase